MQLLSPKKVARDLGFQADERRVVALKMQKKRLQEQKNVADLLEDWDEEKKQRWEAFYLWNQELQQKKAEILLEITELEKKRDALMESVKVYME